MHRFNTCRSIKSRILAAVNSNKWSEFCHTGTVEVINPDYCLENESVASNAVRQLLNSFEEIDTICHRDPGVTLHERFENEKLCEYLEVDFQVHSLFYTTAFLLNGCSTVSLASALLPASFAVN
ncbi:unnamed protein product [Soboliphyme baturini]|uniref:Uncharacterized protein n=1 Tax=Soboliphyme baturini TaxID=241478 RepID=A0A183IM87_9BILA|nr:unnamed protein product [Soboliphyme baturini]